MIQRLLQWFRRKKPPIPPEQPDRLPGEAIPYGKVIKVYSVGLTEKERIGLTHGNARIPPYNPINDPPHFRRVLDYCPPHLRSYAKNDEKIGDTESNELPLGKEKAASISQPNEQKSVHPLTYQGDPGFESECEDATEDRCFWSS